jgi:uncharacterized protein YycO
MILKNGKKSLQKLENKYEVQANKLDSTIKQLCETKEKLGKYNTRNVLCLSASFSKILSHNSSFSFFIFSRSLVIDKIFVFMIYSSLSPISMILRK